MKQIAKHVFMALAATAIIAPTVAMAQPDESDKKMEKKNGEQIIIMRKGDKKEKMVVEIDGDKVTVNGKPIEDLEKNGEVTVMRNKVKDFEAFQSFGGGQSFRTMVGPNGGFTGVFNLDTKSVILGVTTEKAESGVVIRELTKEAGAEKAGLKKGDVITRINDKQITSPDELSKEIKTHKAGDKVTVTYLRDKKEAKTTAELTEWKGAHVFSADALNSFNFDLGDLNEIMPPRTPRAPRIYGVAGGAPKMGISVQDTEDGNGARVLRVDEDGNAGKAGIRVDDVITEVDGKNVNSADEVAKELRENKDKSSVKFRIKRNGKNETIEVKIPKKLKTANL